MPYITLHDRVKFQHALKMLAEVVEDCGLSNGELNYLMTMLAHLYIERHGTSYATLSEVVAAFECAKLEFYRRRVAPYEGAKIIQNGDV